MLQPESVKQRPADSEVPLFGNAGLLRHRFAGQRLRNRLAEKVQRQARQLQRDGFHILVIGRADDPEVQEIVEPLTCYDIVSTLQEVKTYRSRRLGIVCRTTTPEQLVREICGMIQMHNPLAELWLAEPGCEPATERIEAVERLLIRVDALVVVGGRHCHDTRTLAKAGYDGGLPTFRVNQSGDLRGLPLARYRTIGLAAGISTPTAIVDNIHALLLSLGESVGHTRDVTVLRLP